MAPGPLARLISEELPRTNLGKFVSHSKLSQSVPTMLTNPVVAAAGPLRSNIKKKIKTNDVVLLLLDFQTKHY